MCTNTFNCSVTNVMQGYWNGYLDCDYRIDPFYYCFDAAWFFFFFSFFFFFFSLYIVCIFFMLFGQLCLKNKLFVIVIQIELCIREQGVSFQTESFCSCLQICFLVRVSSHSTNSSCLHTKLIKNPCLHQRSWIMWGTDNTCDVF